MRAWVQMQLMTHATLSMQLMLSFESISPQADKRQRLIGDKKGGKDSPLAQLTMQTKNTHGLTSSKLAPAQNSANAGAFDGKSSIYSNYSPIRCQSDVMLPGMPHA